MKKLLTILLITLSLLFISGCGGDESKTSEIFDSSELDATEFKLYASQEFTIKYPINWIIKTDFDKSFPNTTVTSFTDSSRDGFKPNINIDKRKITSGTDSISFGNELLKKHESDLIDFKKIAQQNISFKVAGNKQDSIISVFEGKNNSEGEKYKFIQTYAIKGEYAYTITGTMLTSETDDITSKITTSLKTLELL